MILLFFLCFGFNILKTWAVVIVEAPCPVVKAIENLNLSAFAPSTWYEVAKYPNDWEKLGDCSKISFTKDEKGIRFNGTEIFENEGPVKYLEGYIDNDAVAANSGFLIWRSKIFNASEGVVTMKDYVLDIDYDYQIHYTCKYHETNKFRHDFVWILSKTKQLDQKAKTKIDNYIDSSNLIVKEKLIYYDFSTKLCKDF